MKKWIMLVLFCLSTHLLLSQSSIDWSVYCDYSKLVKDIPYNEKKERQKLYLTLIGVLKRLDKYKTNLIRNKKYIDMFPGVYFQVTSLEVENIRNGIYKEPKWKMNQMIGFFEAYEVNRSLWDRGKKNLVEPHWVNHFKTAEETQTDLSVFCYGFAQTLTTAIDAHIIFDLPRSIRFTNMQYQHSSIPNFDIVKKEYGAVDAIFNKAQIESLKDLNSISSSCTSLSTTWLGKLLSPSIESKRNQAWIDANNKNHEIQYNKIPLGPHPYDVSLREALLKEGEGSCDFSCTLFLFDLSGSMNENGANASISKLQQAKSASKQTLKALKNNNSGTMDEVAVLGFSGGCDPDPTTLISNFETDLSLVESRIDAMVAGGGTPLAEAIAASECKLANHLSQTGQDKGKLIVLSDGQATCQQIRPPGTYNSAPLGQQVINVNANQCGGGNFKIKYYTIGFNIAPGSPAERDLQYLSQISGGKYLNVQSQTQLERAFKKFNRTYIPKPTPALVNLPTTSASKFDNGVSLITTESFGNALKTCEEFAQLHPDDCHGAYNLALMQEANDFYRKAITNYQKYLSLCPNASDKELVEKQIAFLEEEFKQFLLFQKEVVKSDLEYLKLHFEKIQNGQSVALAEEFKGFLKEKGNYYKDLPELMGRTDRGFQRNCLEVFTGLDNCAKTIYRNPKTWDRDATPALSMTYVNLERLLDSF